MADLMDDWLLELEAEALKAMESEESTNVVSNLLIYKMKHSLEH